MKVIANYLPQYHEIPENTRWWGKGFTDWQAVRRAVPLFAGHQEPRVPLDKRYYDLSDVEAIRWQAELAQRYGVYGWGIYHYWFSSDMMLLQRPAELIRDHADIPIHYMFIWDNSSWVRTWSSKRLANDWAPSYDQSQGEHQGSGVLAELVYGTEADWKKHFDYLLTFFRDDRYIKVAGRPMFAIFQPHNDSQTIQRMVMYWNQLAKEAGFPGLLCLTKTNWRHEELPDKICYSPNAPGKFWSAAVNSLRMRIAKKFNRIYFRDYDAVWREVLSESRDADNRTYLSGFVDFDDSPRRGGRHAFCAAARRRSSAGIWSSCYASRRHTARSTPSSRLGTSGARAHTLSQTLGTATHGWRLSSRPLCGSTRNNASWYEIFSEALHCLTLVSYNVSCVCTLDSSVSFEREEQAA